MEIAPSTSASTYYWLAQGVYWSTVEMLDPCADTNSEIFSKWALPNGFCVVDSSSSNGYSYKNPTIISGALGTGIIAAIFALASFAVLCATAANGSTIFVASILGFISCALTIATFSMWLSFGYGQNLRSENGTTMLAYMSDGIVPPRLGVLGPVRMWLGPSWSVTLTSAIILFVTSTVLMIISANIENRRMSGGAYGTL